MYASINYDGLSILPGHEEPVRRILSEFAYNIPKNTLSMWDLFLLAEITVSEVGGRTVLLHRNNEVWSSLDEELHVKLAPHLTDGTATIHTDEHKFFRYVFEDGSLHKEELFLYSQSEIDRLRR